MINQMRIFKHSAAAQHIPFFTYSHISCVCRSNPTRPSHQPLWMIPCTARVLPSHLNSSWNHIHKTINEKDKHVSTSKTTCLWNQGTSNLVGMDPVIASCFVLGTRAWILFVLTNNFATFITFHCLPLGDSFLWLNWPTVAGGHCCCFRTFSLSLSPCFLQLGSLTAELWSGSLSWWWRSTPIRLFKSKTLKFTQRSIIISSSILWPIDFVL